jgi:hypothetical protein
MCSRHERSSFRSSSGFSSRSVSFASPIRVREARADHQERVALVHQRPARLRAEQADRPRHEREVIGNRGPAEERFGDAGAEQLGGLDHLVGRAERALPHEHRDLLARAQDLRGALQVRPPRDDPRPRVAGCRDDRAVLPRRLLLGGLLGEIVRDDQRSDRALVERDAMRTVDQVADLHGLGRHLVVLACDVLEEGDEIDLLLKAAAESHPRLLADDREHRLMVELRVVEAVQQMDRARS